MEQGWSQIPERIGEFAIVRELGVGRRGRVLLGEPHGGGDRVAIAVMDPAHARDRLARRRFARGIDEARRVRGPGIPGVVAADSDAPIPWVATQYLPGPSLAERVAEQGPLPQPEALDVVADIATALHTMHAAGVTHGELDPTYVILAPGGACVVGVGAHPQFDGSAIDDPNADGTAVGFLAPEQVTEDWVGPPADIFSLGAVAYFAATGRSVFGVGSGPEVAGRLVHDEPDLTALANPRLRGLVWDCLGKDPSGRPRADEVARFAKPGTQTRPPALEVGGAAPGASPSSDRPQDPADQGGAPESGGRAAAAGVAAAGVAGSAVARAASSAAAGTPAGAAGSETPATSTPTPGMGAPGSPAGGTGVASAGAAATAGMATSELATHDLATHDLATAGGSRAGVPSGAAASAAGGRTRGGDTGSSRIRRVLPILVASAVLAQLGWVAWSSRGGVEPTSSSTRTAAATPRRAARPAPATTPTASPGAVRSATAAPQPVFPALPLPRRPGTIEPSVQIAPLPPALPVPVIPAPVPAPTRVPTTRTAAPNPAPSSPAPSSRPTSTRPTTTEPTTVPTTPTREPTRPTVSTLPEEPSVSPILPTRPATVDPAPEPTRPRPTQPDPGEADVPTSPDRVTLTSTRATSAAAEGPGPAPVPPSEPTVRPPAATSPVTSPGD